MVLEDKIEARDDILVKSSGIIFRQMDEEQPIVQSVLSQLETTMIDVHHHRGDIVIEPADGEPDVPTQLDL